MFIIIALFKLVYCMGCFSGEQCDSWAFFFSPVCLLCKVKGHQFILFSYHLPVYIVKLSEGH